MSLLDATESRQTRFCRPCNARERLHLGGTCVVCGNRPDDELRPCPGCGRPIAGLDRFCSDRCHRVDEGPADDEDGEL